MTNKKPSKMLREALQQLEEPTKELLAKTAVKFKDANLTDGDELLEQVRKCLEEVESPMDVTIDTLANKYTKHFLVAETILGDTSSGSYKLRVFVTEHNPNRPFAYLTPNST